MKKMVLIALAIFMAIIVLSSCTGSKNTEPMVLNLGLMPAVDTAPIFVAQEKGYFADENLTVNLQIFTSAQDRQTALQTDEIDGALTDLVALTTSANSGFVLKATMLADGIFTLCTGEGALGKTDVTVGTMEISVTNFVVDDWLNGYNVEKVYINALPARMAAAVAGEVDMALLPEPIASAAQMQGLEKYIYEPSDGFFPDVIAFTETALNEKTDAISAFQKAYNKAVADINEDPELARDALMNNIPDLSPALRDAITLPVYNEARLPDDEYLNKIIDWTAGILNTQLIVEPKDIVDDSFLD